MCFADYALETPSNLVPQDRAGRVVAFKDFSPFSVRSSGRKTWLRCRIPDAGQKENLSGTRRRPSRKRISARLPLRSGGVQRTTYSRADFSGTPCKSPPVVRWTDELHEVPRFETRRFTVEVSGMSHRNPRPHCQQARIARDLRRHESHGSGMREMPFRS